MGLQIVILGALFHCPTQFAKIAIDLISHIWDNNVVHPAFDSFCTCLFTDCQVGVPYEKVLLHTGKWVMCEEQALTDNRHYYSMFTTKKPTVFSANILFILIPLSGAWIYGITKEITHSKRKVKLQQLSKQRNKDTAKSILSPCTALLHTHTHRCFHLFCLVKSSLWDSGPPVSVVEPSKKEGSLMTSSTAPPYFYMRSNQNKFKLLRYSLVPAPVDVFFYS